MAPQQLVVTSHHDQRVACCGGFGSDVWAYSLGAVQWWPANCRLPATCAQTISFKLAFAEATDEYFDLSPLYQETGGQHRADCIAFYGFFQLG